MNIEKVASNKVCGGVHQQYIHQSRVLHCQMRFAIFLPPQASKTTPVPVMYWLSGLTCTDENFMQKAGALKLAAELGIAIIAPDTSPRGEDVPDDINKHFSFGLGAGFYLNATQEPWQKNYQMYDYIVDELPQIIESHFAVNDQRVISGHSMGGHGALTIALKNPQRYLSVSAFSPMSNPSQCPWGVNAFTQYLGEDKSTWVQYDTCELLKKANQTIPMLVSQGTDDDFLEEQLKTDQLIKAAKQSNVRLTLNMEEGYDHSYYFVSSFIEQHLKFHAQYL